MDNRPPSKRRKLDTAPVTEHSSPSASSPANRPLTALEIWQQAKARSRQDMGRRAVPASTTEIRRPNGFHNTENAHTPAAPRTPTKATRTLDPLRNQKAAHAVPESPSRTPSALGFFKQFRSPMKALKETSQEHSEGDNLASSWDRHEMQDRPERLHDDGEVEGSSKSDNEQEDFRNNSVRSSGREKRRPAKYNEGKELDRAPGPPNIAPRPSKKTFEDEIKELERNARKEAKSETAPTSAQKPSERKEIRVRGKRRSSIPKVRQAKAARPATVAQAEPDLSVEDDHIQDEAVDEMKIDAVDESLPKPTAARNEPKEATTSAKPCARVGLKPAPRIENILFTSEELQHAQRILLEKIAKQRHSKLVNLDEEYAKVSGLIAQTITAGESNSMLLIGTRGSGKTTMINQVLKEQAAEHANDFHVIRLNGFVHTDDKVAVREIWRQLGREMDTEEDTENGPSRNLADTLTTLLALLSHPAEQGREQEAGLVTRSVIFILDEFDHFATHPRQTLLYNLFDIAQSRKAPIAVVGLTTRIDVAEALEKRVKSRFSHRYVHLSLARSLAGFQDACRAAMTIDNNENKGVTMKSTFGDRWNGFLDQLFATGTFFDLLLRNYYTVKSVPEFLAAMFLPLCTMPTDAEVYSKDLISYFCSQLPAISRPTDTKLSLLSSLSNLHLALLVCAARLVAIHSADAVSFGQAYEEYKVLASKSKIQASAAGALAQGAGARVWGKDVARSIWQELEQTGLIMMETSSGSGKARIDIGLEEIGMSGIELGAWGKWCREI